MEERFAYGVDGSVRHADPDRDGELDEILGLNTAALRGLRRAALRGLVDGLRKRQAGSWSRQLLEQELNRLVAEDPAPEHLGLLVFWLRRSLARR